MKKRTNPSSTRKPKSKSKLRPSQEYVQGFRGKYRGKGLMKELMAEKRRERDL
jgi:hypothetical protein